MKGAKRNKKENMTFGIQEMKKKMKKMIYISKTHASVFF